MQSALRLKIERDNSNIHFELLVKSRHLAANEDIGSIIELELVVHGGPRMIRKRAPVGEKR